MAANLWSGPGFRAGLAVAYFKVNLASALEYRVAFFAQSVGMMVNDSLLLIFWWAYFERFGQVGGWTLADTVALYGLVALVIGLAVVLFGNCTRLALLIAEGQLDYCLVLPGSPLLHLLASRMGLAGWGDVLFGLVCLGIGAGMGAVPVGLALIFTVTGTAIAVGYLTLLGSLAFFMGNAEATTNSARDSLVNFSLYPSPIFRGWTKVLLLTVVPSAFLAHIPVELMRQFDPGMMALLLAFTAGLWVAAAAFFRLGLRRYESGNLITMRG